MAYRLSRNTEASIVDKITIDLAADGWTNIRVEKSFAEAYKGTLACIVINATERPIKRKEITIKLEDLKYYKGKINVVRYGS